MSVKVNKEEDLLQEQTRKAIIQHIQTDAGVKARKEEHKKRAQVYKDRTDEYVLELIKMEMGDQVLAEMKNRVTNINVTRKVVTKKARVYKDQPKRSLVAKTDKGQAVLDGWATVMGLDAFMKGVNRATELHHNDLVQILPRLDYTDLGDDGKARYRIGLRLLRPDRFDVIEDPNNPMEPLAVILSYYEEQGSILDDYRSPRVEETPLAKNEQARTQSKTQLAAAAKKQRFIWWSRQFHFTTDASGKIMDKASPKDSVNELGILPFVSFAKEQTEGFWSDGGDGLADMGILFNLLLADMNLTSKFQGMGLGYISGAEGSVPTSITIGVGRFVRLLYKKDEEPEPKVGFASPSPNLDHSLALLKEQLGLFLTSEGLEPGTMTGDLNASGNASSGLQEMIQRSEPITAIEDDQELYRVKEPELMMKVLKVAKVYQDKKLLCAQLNELGVITDDMKYDLSFEQPQVVLSQSERLNLAKQKKELGYFTPKQIAADLHPEMEEAQLDELLQELGLNKPEGAADGEPELEAEGKPVLDAQGKPVMKAKAAAGAAPGKDGLTVQDAAAPIADVSLNGAQITSVLAIVEAVVGGQMPIATAKALVAAGFPSLDEKEVQAIFTPLTNFKPEKKPMPAGFGGPPAPKEGPPKPEPKPMDGPPGGKDGPGVGAA